MEENGSQRISVSVDIEIANLKKQMAEAQKRISELGVNAQKEGEKIDEAFEGVTDSAKQMTESVTSGLKSMIAGMVGFTSAMKVGDILTSAVNNAKKFDSAMMEVSTISKEVADSMGEYKDQIMEMTTQIPIGAEESAKALYQIASAGYSGAEGMKVLEVSARNAIGGVTETVTSADAITTILNAYKMQADDAEKVSDLLFTTVKLGKTTMSELGASIAQVAPMASSFGVGIDSVLAGIASLTKQGTPTSVAITQIRASLVAMSKTLGATYFQTHTLQEGLVEMAKRFPDANKLKEEAGTIEAVNAVLGMTGKNAESASKDLEDLQNSSGATQDAFKKMLVTFENQTKLLANNLQKAFQPLAEALLKSVSNVAEAINGMFESGQMEVVLTILKDLIIVYGSYKTAVILASVASKAWITIQQEMTRQQLLSNVAMEIAGDEMVALSTKQKLSMVATEKLRKAWKSLTLAISSNPFVAIATAIAVAGVAIYELTKKSQELTASQKSINSIEEKVNESTAEQIVKVNQLQKAVHDANATDKERKKAIADLKAIIPDYTAELDKEGKVIKENTSAVQDYIEALKQEARVKASQDELVEIEKKRMSIERENRKLTKEKEGLQKTQKEIDAQGSNWQSHGTAGVTMAGTSQMHTGTRVATINGKMKDNAEALEELKQQEADIDDYIGKNTPKTTTTTTTDGGGGGGGGNNTSNDGAELKKKLQKLAEMQKDYKEQLEELNRTTQNEIDRANLEALQDSTDKELELRRQANKERLEEIEKGKKDEIKAQIERVKAIWEADPAHEGKKATKNSAGREAVRFNEADLQNGTGAFAEGGSYRQYYIDTQKVKANAQNKANALVGAENAQLNKDTKGAQDALRKLDNDYLREFGTMMQKRQAIVDDYNMQIEQATSESQKRILQAQKEATLAEFDFKNSQDFGSLFATDVTFFPKDKLEQMKKQLTGMLQNTDLGAEQYKTIADQIDKINSALVNSEQGIKGLFESQLPILQERKKLTQDVLFAEQSINALNEQRTTLEGKRNGIVSQIEGMTGVSNVSTGNTQLQAMAKADPILKSLLDELQKADKALDDNTQALDSAKTKKSTSEDKLKVFSENFTKQLQNVGQYINLVGTNASGAGGLMEQMGMDTSKGAGKTIAGLANGANDAMGAYADFMSGNYIGALTKGISAVENFGTALGLWSNGNIEAQQDYIDRLERSNKSLEGAINDLKDAMENASPSEAVDLYNQQVKLTKQEMENTQNQMKAEASKWSKGSHSIGYNLNNDINFRRLAIKAMSYGATSADAQGVLSMTGEQWKNLRDNNTELYNALMQAFRDAETGKNGEGIDNMIDDFVDKFGNAFADLKDELNQTLLGIDFSGLLDSFASTLIDMDSSVEDFADNMTKTLNNAILKALVNEKYKDRIQKLYDYMAQATKDGIQQNEADYIKQESENISEALLEERERLKEQGLITDDDTASQAKSKGFNAMSQDTGNELNGRFTAMQISMELQNQKLDALVVDSSVVKAQAVMQTTIMQENQSLLIQCQSHLEDISRNTSVLPAMSSNIDRMREKIDTL